MDLSSCRFFRSKASCLDLERPLLDERSDVALADGSDSPDHACFVADDGCPLRITSLLGCTGELIEAGGKTRPRPFDMIL
jgi:hypothetical protein